MIRKSCAGCWNRTESCQIDLIWAHWLEHLQPRLGVGVVGSLKHERWNISQQKKVWLQDTHRNVQFTPLKTTWHCKIPMGSIGNTSISWWFFPCHVSFRECIFIWRYPTDSQFVVAHNFVITRMSLSYIFTIALASLNLVESWEVAEIMRYQRKSTLGLHSMVFFSLKPVADANPQQVHSLSIAVVISIQFTEVGSSSREISNKNRSRHGPCLRASAPPDMFQQAVFRGSLNGTHFGGIKMQIYGDFQGFAPSKVHCLGWYYKNPCSTNMAGDGSLECRNKMEIT